MQSHLQAPCVLQALVLFSLCAAWSPTALGSCADLQQLRSTRTAQVRGERSSRESHFTRLIAGARPLTASSHPLCRMTLLLGSGERCRGLHQSPQHRRRRRHHRARRRHALRCRHAHQAPLPACWKTAQQCSDHHRHPSGDPRRPSGGRRRRLQNVAHRRRPRRRRWWRSSGMQHWAAPSVATTTSRCAQDTTIIVFKPSSHRCWDTATRWKVGPLHALPWQRASGHPCRRSFAWVGSGPACQPCHSAPLAAGVAAALDCCLARLQWAVFEAAAAAARSLPAAGNAFNPWTNQCAKRSAIIGCLR